MCGIAGFFDPKKRISDPAGALGLMTDAIFHRGPDDSGEWFDPAAGVALGHRRLSILDLSPAGHQPMSSPSGRYVIAFNGEIYNFHRIRQEIEKVEGNHPWRGHSDTEVMLAAFETWGVEDAVRRFTGMFAIALWDREARCLHLMRDRIGEKPLYYGWSGNVFLFGSELKALRAHPAWQAETDRGALALFLRHNYVPAPFSIYAGIHKLVPGAVLTLRTESDPPGLLPEPVPYWSFAQAVADGLDRPFGGTEHEAVDQLDTLLRDAIGQQMVADVPLGAFLSGGVDSSAIVALMQAQSSRPVRTFTIGFHEAAYNEANHAKAVARHLGTDHTELYATPRDALDVIPRLPELYDEPFSDSSQIPTSLVSQLTRRHVTVSLSGDAGDELFGGYNRYFLGRSIWRTIGWMPRGLRSGLAAGCTTLSPACWEALGTFLPKKVRPSHFGDRMHKLADIVAVESPAAMYRRLVSHWGNPGDVVCGASEPETVFAEGSRTPDMNDFTLKMMFLDTLSYLPDDILVKVDRAAMGVSLETRVPFLDHRVVEFAWRLPLSLKIRGNEGKWILRQVLYRYVPRDLMERPKTGFGVPIDSWLRGPLREWAETLLDEGRLRREGFFRPEPIRKKWSEHLSGKRNWQYHLWDILMFEAWLERQQRGAGR